MAVKRTARDTEMDEFVVFIKSFSDDGLGVEETRISCSTFEELCLIYRNGYDVIFPERYTDFEAMKAFKKVCAVTNTRCCSVSEMKAASEWLKKRKVNSICLLSQDDLKFKISKRKCEGTPSTMMMDVLKPLQNGSKKEERVLRASGLF
tara:strand:- start:7855 stop:8301 length:447 start_codon:yes stop_codon:yes gene_type:complete